MSVPFLAHSLRRLLFLLAFVLAAAPVAYAGERPVKGGELKPAVIYHNYCSVCHGDRGDGNSRAKGSLEPPPRDFTKANDLARETMVAFITNGKPGTAMMAWKTQLTAKEIEAVVDYIRNNFMQVALDPRLIRGRQFYAHNCAVCHGDRGQGAPATVGLVPPRDLSSPQARTELTRERMIGSVTSGHPNAGFAGKLQSADLEAVVDYVRAALMIPDTEGISGTRARAEKPVAAKSPQQELFANGLTGDVRRGEKLYMATCITCHGAKGDGKGPRAYFINPKPRNFVDPGIQAAFNRPLIYAAVANGRTGSEMPAWSKVLSEQEITDVSEFVFRRFILAGKAQGKPKH
jgi:mono/diheme cytochrome c family protein